MLALCTGGVEWCVVTGVTCGELSCSSSTASATGTAVLSGDSLLAGVTAAGVSQDGIKLVDGS